MKREAVLVLPGGGANGGVQAGELAELDAHYTWTHAIGTSVGAINAAGLMRHGADYLVRMWSAISDRDVHRGWTAGRVLGRIVGGGASELALYDTTPLRELLEREVPGETRGARACWVSLASGREYYMPARPADILASAAIPGVYPPVDGCVDGGIRKVAPLGAAMEMEPAEIVVVLCGPMTLDPEPAPRSPLDVLRRSLAIATNEILLSNIREHRRINDLVLQAAQRGVTLHRSDGRPYRYVPLLIVEPDRSVSHTLDFSPAANAERIEVGRSAARRALAARQEAS